VDLVGVLSQDGSLGEQKGGRTMPSVFEVNGDCYKIDGVEVSKAEWEARFARQREEEDAEADAAEEADLPDGTPENR